MSKFFLTFNIRSSMLYSLRNTADKKHIPAAKRLLRGDIERKICFLMVLCVLSVAVLAGTAQGAGNASVIETKAALADTEKGLTGTARNAGQCQAKLNKSRAKSYGSEYHLPNVFSILSWNIYKAQNKNLLEDLTALSRKVDIVLLQEAFEDKNLESLKPYWRFAPGYRSDNMQSGVMTLSYWPASVHCQFSHQEPWLNTPKATNVVEYVLQNGERLLAINLHAINFTWGTKAYHEQLNTAAAIMRAHQGPIIFAGDLNSWSHSRRKVLTDVLEPLGLVATEFPVDNRTLIFGLALDYVWLRGVNINAAKVPIYQSSDHNPLLVTVKIIKPKLQESSYVVQN